MLLKKTFTVLLQVAVFVLVAGVAHLIPETARGAATKADSSAPIKATKAAKDTVAPKSVSPAPGKSGKTVPSTPGSLKQSTEQTIVLSFSPRFIMKGGKSSLILSHSPARVEVYSSKRRLGSLPGKGRKSFDISRFIPKVVRGQLGFRIYGSGNDYEEKSFDISRQLAKLESGQEKAADKKAVKSAEKGRKSVSVLGMKSQSLLPQVGVGAQAPKSLPGAGVRRVEMTQTSLMKKPKPRKSVAVPSGAGMFGASARKLNKPRPPEEDSSISPGGSSEGFGLATVEMSASSLAHAREPEYPARITRVTDPVAVGSGLIVLGSDFGHRQGLVDISVSTSTHVCDITDWQDDVIRCMVPISLGPEVGTARRDARVWVKPAAVAPPDPGTMSTSISGETERPYPYSGDEGPGEVIMLSPMVPVITSLSVSEISPLDEIEIRGRKFGDRTGTLGFESGGEDYRAEVLSWSNRSIRMRLTDAVDDSYGYGGALYDGASRAADIMVTNESGNSDTSGITLVPGVEPPRIKLGIAGVYVTRSTTTDGRRQTNIRVTVENREDGRTWRRFQVLAYGDVDMAVWIDDGIGPHQEETVWLRYVDDDWRTDLDFHVNVNRDRNVPETDDYVQNCHVSFLVGDTARTYSCITM